MDTISTARVSPNHGFASGRPLRVLIADDDEPVRSLMARILAQSGCDVVAVSDGAEAVAAGSENDRPFDVVVLDVAMPRKSGVEAYREIARRDSGPRFLFTSAYYESRQLHDVLREGRSGFLAKPFLPGCMLGEVQSLVGDRSNEALPEMPDTLPILFD